MSILTALLLVKIAVTALLVCLPFLLLPQRKLERLLQVKARNSTLFRLYGVAMLALLVGYGFGVAQTLNGHFPWLVVTVGVVSNAGAALVLGLFGSGRQNRMAAAFFGGIAVLLVLSAFWPELAMTKLTTEN